MHFAGVSRCFDVLLFDMLQSILLAFMISQPKFVQIRQ